jgi:hypothetical protein
VSIATFRLGDFWDGFNLPIGPDVAGRFLIENRESRIEYLGLNHIADIKKMVLLNIVGRNLKKARTIS